MNKILGGIIVGLLLVINLQQFKSCRTEHTTSDAAMRADSLAAALDSTRQLAGESLQVVQRVYGDSIRAVERRVIQVAPGRDTIDKLLARERLANQSLQAQVETLMLMNQAGSPVSEPVEGERSARFNIRDEPFTVTAQVTLPGVGKEARMDTLRVALDSARLYIRQQCGEPVNGFRPATIMITTPAWLKVRVDTAIMAPGACNPPPRRRWVDGRISVGPGAFLYLGPDHTLRATVGLGVHISVWRWP